MDRSNERENGCSISCLYRLVTVALCSGVKMKYEVLDGTRLVLLVMQVFAMKLETAGVSSFERVCDAEIATR